MRDMLPGYDPTPAGPRPTVQTPAWQIVAWGAGTGLLVLLLLAALSAAYVVPVSDRPESHSHPHAAREE